MPGLWACGEVARTGLHGANRLASNSLLEALVVGAAVGRHLARSCCPPHHPLRVSEVVKRARVEIANASWIDGAAVDVSGLGRRIRELMWRFVGLERDATGLERAAVELRDVASGTPSGLGELSNGLLVAKMVVWAARARTESRGAHLRRDFPALSACWSQPLIFEGERMLEPHPVTSVAVSG